MDRFVPLIARVLLSVIFIKSGVDKFLAPDATQQFMAAKGLPFPGLLLIPTVLIEIGGGLAVMLGVRAKWAAWALFLFLIPTTLIFHGNIADRMQMIQFLKNLAIMGGLLLIATYGSGPLSLDRRLDKQ